MTVPITNTAGLGVIEVARLLRGAGDRPARLVCVFGDREDASGSLKVRYILDLPDTGYRVLDETVNGPGPVASISRITPAAAWYERELQDQYGVRLPDHPDPRRLLLHENWPPECHPMISSGQPIPWAEGRYDFLQAAGDGVCEVAVGPVHAGIIEPGHFRFSVMGDNVLFLELRHFYTHKGTEKLFEGMQVLNGPMLAESISGDNCFAHAVAYCQAIEEAHGVTVPPRAEAIRLIGLELERMMAHIADVGALSGDVAFQLPAAYCSRIKEDLIQVSTRVLGTRYLRGIAVPGGVARDVVRDIDPSGATLLAQGVKQAADDFARIASIIIERPSVQARFEDAGILAHNVAEDLAVVGLAARASGVDIDLRRDHPYGAYRGLQVEVPTLHYGDVLARARIRIEEVVISANLVLDAVSQLPPGPLRVDFPLTAAFEGFSAVESPRGELLYWVRGDAGKLSRCYVKSPSFQNWPAVPHAVAGNVIADFPLINKSFNLSYSGCDR
ncbi:MAG TPA: NADH-quinone oxidoreductase subunit C [Candidatus Saccharimonadales bacterium]|nr:NADH-quinone oxidoreductase subunit C [Candidatus Saccharimonadales bacterium]